MAFPRGPLRPPTRDRIRVSVFAVGRQVYAACVGEGSAGVTLADADKRPLATLRDGTEVAILAWRPGWGGATLYRVRATESGLEGWLPVGNLRGTKAATSSAPTTPLPPAVPPASVQGEEFGESGRRFGQRSGSGRWAQRNGQ